MQESVGKGEGGMVAVLGSDIKIIEKIMYENKENFECYIANDNSNGQLVVSGTILNINKFCDELTIQKIKNIKLSVSAPFHCKLMRNATKIMEQEISKLPFSNFKNKLISNVTASEIDDKNLIKDLLIKNIENRVRWRESVEYMISNKVKSFIEIGPGKVLSGLIKRIDRNVKVSAINSEEAINSLKIDD